MSIYITLLQILNITQRVKERKTDSLKRNAREAICPGEGRSEKTECGKVKGTSRKMPVSHYSLSHRLCSAKGCYVQGAGEAKNWAPLLP